MFLKRIISGLVFSVPASVLIYMVVRQWWDRTCGVDSLGVGSYHWATMELTIFVSALFSILCDCILSDEGGTFYRINTKPMANVDLDCDFFMHSWGAYKWCYLYEKNITNHSTRRLRLLGRRKAAPVSSTVMCFELFLCQKKIMLKLEYWP